MRRAVKTSLSVLAAVLALAASAHAAPGQRYDVQRDGTEVHAGPNAKARVIARLNRGDRVIEWRRKGAWVEISQMGAVGRNGWVRLSSLRTEASEIEIRMGPDGHFHTQVLVNGEAIDFLVDTGASAVALTQDDARRLGLDVDNLRYTTRVRTANGETWSAPVMLDELKIGLLSVRNVRGGVNKGRMSKSLLGMTFLRRLRGYEVVGDRLLLRW